MECVRLGNKHFLDNEKSVDNTMEYKRWVMIAKVISFVDCSLKIYFKKYFFVKSQKLHMVLTNCASKLLALNY